MIAVDTNLLIYAHRTTTPEHAAALSAIEQLCSAAQCAVCLPSIGEFWSIVTNAQLAHPASTSGQAKEFLVNLFNAGVQLWLPTQKFEERLIGLAKELKVVAAHIFDLQIGLIALENGARELWTHDKNFTKIPGLRLHDPLA